MDRSLQVDKNYSITVDKDMSVQVSKNLKEEIKEDHTQIIGKKLSVQCGEVSILIEKDGKITIQGKKITVKGDGPILVEGKKLDVKSKGAVTVEASGKIKIKGNSVNMN